MGLFKNVPKPTCWPPPKDAAGVNSLLDYARNRDPIGDKVHGFFACLFLFCLPLDTAPASISMGLLIAYSLMRVPTIWRACTPLIISPLYWVIIAWGAWTTLSIAWSTDRVMGWDHVGSMWLMAIPLPALLYPVLRYWKTMIACFLVGVLIQNGVQICQLVIHKFGWEYSFIIPEPGSRGRPSGLTAHPGNASIFMATAFILWCSTIIHREKLFIVGVPAMILTLFGIVVSMSRAVWLGLGLSVFIIIWHLCSKKIMHWRKTIPILIAVCSVAIVSSSFVFPTLKNRIKEVPKALVGYFAEGTVKSGTQERLHWWATEVEQSFESPILQNALVGHGCGSSSQIDFSLDGQKIKANATHPHNAFVQTLYENGIIGLGLFSFMILAILRSPKHFQSDLVKLATISIVSLWVIRVFFDGAHVSGRVLAILMLVATVFVVPKRFCNKEPITKN